MGHLWPICLWAVYHDAALYLDACRLTSYPLGHIVGYAMTRRQLPWLDKGDEVDEPDIDFGFDHDQPPVWEKLDPKKGLPVWEALFHFVDRRMAAELFELDLSGYGDLDNLDPSWWPDERREFEQKYGLHCLRLLDLQAQIWGKLLRGELVAYGFSNQAPLDAPRRSIAAERWLDLELGAKSSTASGPGIEVTQLLIYEPGRQGSPEARSSSKRYSTAELREWYADRILGCHREGRRPSREDDYREANARFEGVIPKRAVESLRRELAPDSWRRKGRRPKS